jgi:RimJ/RimL family protein N-acetyltransferase
VAESVRLRPVSASDLEQVVRLIWDPTAPGEFQWFGFRMDKAREIERRWHDDGLIGDELSFLSVAAGEAGEEACAGWVSWRRVRPATFEIGISLFLEYRGRGIGTEAQRQLVDYLFATTPVHRVQAGTETGNVAEQRALERVGFRREGVLRGVGIRAGEWRDGVMYGLVRDDWKS